jgi:hypothetical protein
LTSRWESHTVGKSRYLTLDQLPAFVQEALRSGAAGTEQVEAGVVRRHETRRRTFHRTPS